MSSRETRRTLDEAGRSIAELSRALDEAAERAVIIGASDTLEQIAAAKAATARGLDCLHELREKLLGLDGADSSSSW